MSQTYNEVAKKVILSNLTNFRHYGKQRRWQLCSALSQPHYSLEVSTLLIKEAIKKQKSPKEKRLEGVIETPASEDRFEQSEDG